MFCLGFLTHKSCSNFKLDEGVIMDQLRLSNIESPHDLMISHSIVVLIIVLILFKTLLGCFYIKCSGEHLRGA
ncbi:hypothetical protein HanRHA438_Chr06g0265961 [Helianthus annuus]|nr:hypothetical protein HanRHA438_Chr06g0265961 [Helianthus annuus]